MARNSSADTMYIMGLAHAYPQYSFTATDFQKYIAELYPEQHTSSPGLQKLIRFSNVTQIESRPTISDLSFPGAKVDASPPSPDELSRIFKADGVQLAASACTKAMAEANVGANDITHIVAVTCTDQSNPGYELLVCNKLKLQPGVQRTLLHGVGCAGGLSALRAAANTAAAESQRGRPARVLVVACEICSLFLKAELHAASQSDDLHIAPALFSDAAAALVVCNDLALRKDQKPIYELKEWGSMVVPNTTSYMSYDITSTGMIASLTKDVPKAAVSAIQPMFDHLLTKTPSKSNLASLLPPDFDWAIHPGGAAILSGAQKALHLTDEHIRASLETYRSYGNSSSPTVLVVLDRLRHMGQGRDDVVAASFGPGMMIEMCMMKRCRGGEIKGPLGLGDGKKTGLWMGVQSKMKRVLGWNVDKGHGAMVL
ncbi:hypothetical protein ACEQ8H_005504 [Pleosporales sp. CAS-2024a]